MRHEAGTRGLTRRVAFATSNDHKFREVSLVLEGLGVKILRLSSKGVEVQSDDLAEIASLAAAHVSRSARRPLIVEDTGLFIGALNGFPGPYANFAYRTLGLMGLVTLLERVKKRDAKFESVVAYCAPGVEPRVFRGFLQGRIGMRPLGSNGFGFDPLFIPNGESVTLAQMSLRRKCSLSHRAIAARKFGLWYSTSLPKQPLSAESRPRQMTEFGQDSFSQAR